MQLDAFLLPPFQRYSQTSRKAAVGMYEDAPSIRARVYAYIASRGTTGATDEDIQVSLGLDGSTERPRRVELVRMGKVADSSHTGLTRKGRQAVLWVVCG